MGARDGTNPLEIFLNIGPMEEEEDGLVVAVAVSTCVHKQPINRGHGNWTLSDVNTMARWLGILIISRIHLTSHVKPALPTGPDSLKSQQQ
ncbi:hypothetical protein PoB_001708500 [Plakobranchus ocellatus]|uniref:Uncharacterized protein n=1 Tax=Plakobranchus ocellatus TaxID=259542 RepID=A0AAV3Z7N2_9GAST|nr:hypothetical protein PoB_001708500 [Plakobranchus ocellatus]